MPVRASTEAPAPSATAAELTAAARQAPAVESILALQRSIGNAAVKRLLRYQPTIGAGAQAAPTATTERQRFDAQMRDRWQVTRVRTGTEADQVAGMRAATPTATASPTSIGGWQEWDPGPQHDLYNDILDAFEQMAFVLGGIPEVTELRFLDVDYENVGGSAQRRPGHAATYGAGLFSVFSSLQSATWPLPTARSTSGPAPTSAGSASDSRRRILVHELCHGVYERFGSPMLGGTTQFFRDWEAAAGWSGGQIEQGGTRLTASNWNDPWPEQPVSAYALRNPMEDFCESLMCFIESGAVLRDRSPARHGFITARLGAWRTGLRQPRGFDNPLRRRPPAGDFPGPSGDERYA